MLRVCLEPWSLRIAAEKATDDDALYVADEADLRSLDEGVLLRIYNTVAGSALRRFPRHSVALSKTWELVREFIRSAPLGTELTASSEGPDTETAGPEPEVSRRTQLQREIGTLRRQLAEKSAELRELEGRTGLSETPTVAKVLRLLTSPDGATKEELIRETGAKKGYIDALLSRILGQKGYLIRAKSVAGRSTKTYFVDSETGEQQNGG
jgi:hypothetical protein